MEDSLPGRYSKLAVIGGGIRFFVGKAMDS